MFGKPRTTPAAAERHAHPPLPECNVAILGCRGSGKSGWGQSDGQGGSGEPWRATLGGMSCSRHPASPPGDIPQAFMGLFPGGDARKGSPQVLRDASSCPPSLPPDAALCQTCPTSRLGMTDAGTPSIPEHQPASSLGCCEFGQRYVRDRLVPEEVKCSPRAQHSFW